MPKYRIIEQPFGTFRVERKGWFFWHSLCFRKSDAGRFLVAPDRLIGFLPLGAVHTFRCESDAVEALREAIPETAYRRVVPL